VGEFTQTSPSPVDEATLDRFADLIVGLGANVQPGQIVEVRAAVERHEFVAKLAASAYRRGAKFVDVNYYDPWVRRTRIVHAPPKTLDFAPSWAGERVLELGRNRCARIAITPQGPSDMFADLDPALVAREPYPFLPEYFEVIRERTTNWTGSTYPTDDWAARVHPELEPDEALARLWEQVLHVCRLDEPDPIAAWKERFARLDDVKRRLDEQRLDALHFEGPGTDLTIGLLPSSNWEGGPTETVDGIRHVPNLPTEEVFTTPDPERTEGVVRATKPLRMASLVRGLVLRFEGGRAVQVDADEGAELVREALLRDEGAARLGEVALVDAQSRIGQLDTVFYSTLLDENAASHIALGNGYLEPIAEEDWPRVNESKIHIDFMIGADDVDVTGITRAGERVPVLRSGAWQV
jgi:aminopeptidase